LTGIKSRPSSPLPHFLQDLWWSPFSPRSFFSARRGLLSLPIPFPATQQQIGTHSRFFPLVRQRQNVALPPIRCFFVEPFSVPFTDVPFASSQKPQVFSFFPVSPGKLRLPSLVRCPMEGLLFLLASSRSGLGSPLLFTKMAPPSPMFFFPSVLISCVIHSDVVPLLSPPPQGFFSFPFSLFFLKT